MNTHTVSARTVWAMVVMEAGLAFPLISLPTQGDRIVGVLGPLLLLALLPLGYLAVREMPALRDPSWRLLAGIGLALLTRAVVSTVPDEGLSGLAVWLGRSIVPAAIGVGLWWRGAAMTAAELTAAEVRAEFSVLAVLLIAALALIRPFLSPDPLLLGASVGLFAAGGLIATALSRQDAAELVSLRFGRTLATLAAVLPALAAVVLVGILRPSLLVAMWTLVGQLIELALTPIGLLIAWLASLFPRSTPGPPPLPTPRPFSDVTPNTAALAEVQDRLAWIGTLVVISLLIAAGIALIVLARIMLSNWIAAPPAAERQGPPELTVERSGTPRTDAHDLFGWLLRWMRGRWRFADGRPRAPARAVPEAAAPTDAWAAYQRLLEWAARQGLGRRPPETTGQLRTRLARHAPEAANAVDLVTDTWEWERYGEIHPRHERLRRVHEALRHLADH